MPFSCVCLDERHPISMSAFERHFLAAQEYIKLGILVEAADELKSVDSKRRGISDRAISCHGVRSQPFDHCDLHGVVDEQT